MTNRAVRERLLASTIIAGAIVAAAPAFAQDASAPAGSTATAPDSSGEIVVTGSLIKNPALAGQAPVQVLGQEEVQLRQTNTAEEILRDLPGAVASIGSAVNNGNGGASTVDLRGLGSNRNLVLLDGNRIVPYSLGGVTDLNNIPLALIQRTEVLTGGASTTYGADAISGVVNFITRDDFSGVEASAGNQITSKGDGAYYRADVTIGANFDDGKGNAVFSIGYQNSNAVYQGDRGFSNRFIDSFSGNPGGSGTSVPTRFGIAGTTLGTRQINPSTGALVPTFAQYNYNPFNVFQTPFKRFNIYGAGHYDVTDDITVYTRGMFSKNTVETIIAPSGAFGITAAIPFSNPYLPAAARAQICTALGLSTATCNAAAAATSTSDPNYRTFTATVSRRTPEVGPRVSSFVTNEFDYRAGIKGNITSNLHFDINGSYGESDNIQNITGYTLNSRFRDALLATNTSTCLSGNAGCVPVNVFGGLGSITPAMVSYLTAASSSYVKTSLGQARGVLSGDFGYHTPWAADAINFAAGAEYRNYRASQGADSLANSGDLGGAGSATPNIVGGYEVTEGFGELIAPLVEDMPGIKNLTINGGIRYSHYKIFTAGNPEFNTTTWKAGGEWSPIDAIKFRGVYQHAVRAPNIGELFSPVIIGLTSLSVDPCAGSAPTGNANLAAVCRAQGAPANTIGNINQPSAGQVNETGGGNPQLKPEKSNSYTIGLVLQPKQWIKGLSATVDYYHIKVTGAVSSPSASDVIGACFNNLTAASATNPACTAIRRSPIDGTLSGDGVGGIPLQISNLGTLETDGIDLGVQYRHDFGIVVLNASFEGNWTNHSKFQAAPGDFTHDCVGYYSTACASIQPKFYWNQRTTVTYQNIDVSLLWRHLDKMNQEPYDIANVDGPAFPGFGHIKPYNYFDMSVRVSAGDHMEFTVTVQNMLGTKPPLVGGDIGTTSFNSGNTYPSTYDALGRRFAVGAKLKF